MSEVLSCVRVLRETVNVELNSHGNLLIGRDASLAASACAPSPSRFARMDQIGIEIQKNVSWLFRARSA